MKQHAYQTLINGMDEIIKKLYNINQALDKHNETLEKMLEIMSKPENPFAKALTLAGVGVGILGIIQVIDTIVKWFGG